MSSIENRTVHANQQLTLSVREEKNAPENDTAVAKVMEIFDKLARFALRGSPGRDARRTKRRCVVPYGAR